MSIPVLSDNHVIRDMQFRIENVRAKPCFCETNNRWSIGQTEANKLVKLRYNTSASKVLGGQTPTLGGVWSNIHHHHLVSNTPRISHVSYLESAAFNRSLAFSEHVPFMFTPTSLDTLLLSIQYKSLMGV